MAQWKEGSWAEGSWAPGFWERLRVAPKKRENDRKDEKPPKVNDEAVESERQE